MPGRFSQTLAHFFLSALLSALPGLATATEPQFACRAGSTDIATGLVDYPGNTAMLLRPDGRPVIAYSDYNPGNAIWLHLCSDVECNSGTTRLIEANAAPYSVDLSLVLQGDKPVIGYYDKLASPPGIKLYLCSDATCSSGVPRKLTNAQWLGITPRVSLSPEQRPFVTATDMRTASDNLLACRCDDAVCSGWQCRSVQNGSGGGFYSSTVWRDDGTALIGHVGAGGADVYQCANSNCSPGLNHHQQDQAGGANYTAMTLRENGWPLLLYGAFGVASSNDLGVPVLIDCADTNCTARTSRILDATPRKLRIVRMAMRSNGRAFAIYGEDSAPNSLYFHQCTDRDCRGGRNGVVMTEADHSHDVAIRASPDHDPNKDVAVVVYRPYRVGTIKLAFCSLPTDLIFIDDFDPR